MARASPRARCSGVVAVPKYEAIVASLWLRTSGRGSARRARASVSATRGFGQGRPDARAARRRKPTSKEALCATRTGALSPSSPDHSMKRSRTEAIGSASATIAGVMPVSDVMNGGMGREGRAREENSSVMRPSRTETAPISVISAPAPSPVVSRSTTTQCPREAGVPTASRLS